MSHISFLQPNFNFDFIWDQLIGNLNYIFKIPYMPCIITRVSPWTEVTGAILKYVAFRLPHILYHPSVLLLGLYRSEMCTLSSAKYMLYNVHRSTDHSSRNLETSSCPSREQWYVCSLEIYIAVRIKSNIDESYKHKVEQKKKPDAKDIFHLYIYYKN